MMGTVINIADRRKRPDTAEQDAPAIDWERIARENAEREERVRRERAEDNARICNRLRGGKK